MTLLTTRDVARLLRVHPNTVKRWTDRGDIRVIRLNERGDRRYDPEDVRAFIEQRRATDD